MDEYGNNFTWNNAMISSLESQLEFFCKKIDEKRRLFVENRYKIQEIESKISKATDYRTLQNRDIEITNQIAKLQAKVESYQNFQREIQNGLCPIFSQRCLNLKEDETLQSFVNSNFSEFKKEIKALKKEKHKVHTELKLSIESEKALAFLESCREREKEIINEGKSLRFEIEGISKQIEELRFSTVSASRQIQKTRIQAIQQEGLSYKN